MLTVPSAAPGFFGNKSISNLCQILSRSACKPEHCKMLHARAVKAERASFTAEGAASRTTFTVLGCEGVALECAHILFLLCNGLESTMAMLGGGINEFEIDLLLCRTRCLRV